jgi:thiosulfate/3-mercaptopyruvate sulfurtransferase
MSYTTLVDCATLAAHLADTDWRIFDCRHQLSDPNAGEQAYAAGHLPGAHFLHLDRDLAGPLNGKNGRHPLPDPQQLAQKLAAMGVAKQTQVVVYDDAGGMIAGRLWWLLRWLGHERVAVLDGGIDQWRKEGQALSRETPPSTPTAAPMLFAAELYDERDEHNHTVDVETLLTNLTDGALCVIDARSPDRFRGENETIDPVGGHIPGARNRFFRDNLDADGKFRSAAELRRAFLALLADVAPDHAVMHCGSGVTACHNLLAMEIAGLSGARLYPGSWSEWCSDPARPVAR